MSNLGLMHYQAAKKVFRFLQGTKDHMLTYQRSSLLDVMCYCDADYKDCMDDKKSITGYLFIMAEDAVSWHNANVFNSILDY